MKKRKLEAVAQRRIAILLSLQTVILILGSANRLMKWSHTPVAANGFLRWVDFNHLLVFPPLTILVSLAIRQTFVNLGKKSYIGVDVLFVLSVYFLGAGYGVHELANYLSSWTAGNDSFSSDFQEIIRFNDDDFSHWIFFGAFVGVNLSVLLWQYLNPFSSPLKKTELILILCNALILAAAIFANLSQGKLGFDLVALLVLAVPALIFWCKNRSQPIFLFYFAGLWLGLVATFFYRN